MIPRRADHAYWMGRYLQRAESVALGLGAAHAAGLDAETTATACMRPVLDALGLSWPLATEDDAEQAETRLARDPELAEGLVRTVQAARWNARALRDLLSFEVWETINELHLWIPSAPADTTFQQDRFAFYSRIRRGTGLAAGLSDTTMPRDAAHAWLSLGRHLEHAIQIGRWVSAVAHQGHAATVDPRSAETLHALYVVRGVGAAEAFARTVPGAVTVSRALRFALHERTCPRALAFCAARIDDGLHRLGLDREPRFSRCTVALADALAQGAPDEQLPDLAAGLVLQLETLARLLEARPVGYAPADPPRDGEC